MRASIKNVLWYCKFFVTYLPKAFNEAFFARYPYFAIDFRTWLFRKTCMGRKNHNAKVFRDDIAETFNEFLTQEELADKAYVNRLTNDVVRCYILYGIAPDEYFLHDFRNKSDEYRMTILSRKRKDDLCCWSLGIDTREYFMQIKDKWKFYELTSSFFKRDVCRVEKDSDLSGIEQFCAKHSRFIAKPRLGSSGIGVHVVDLNKESKTAKELLKYYQKLDDGKWMFEEFIVQDQVMAAWHPSSVNTIRIPSIRTKHGCEVILPLFRIGKNGNLVDNCHNNGGLMAVPDAKTGKLLTDGYDIYQNVVEYHPNSGMKFMGWQVPKWDELIALSAQVHMSLPPKHKYIGFDFALTPEGWVLLEGNWGNVPHQVCVGYGIRKEFEKLMKS